MTALTTLLHPFRLNKVLTLKNRIVMAPMTRNKADANLAPTEQMAIYYARRADAGLIVTEGTIIRPDARGYSNVPGLYSPAQIDGWRKVTEAVHAKGGHLFAQIWHVGRVTHPIFLEGKLPLSASETLMTGVLKRQTYLQYQKSRAASISEIKELVESYARAAHNAIQAGFDGVEIHGANGYLIDQFLHYITNHRQDEYGGSPENMARFALEVIRACGEAIGYEKVAIRLSPGGYLHEIESEKRDALVFQYLLEKLNDFPISYIHTGNFDDAKKFDELGDQTMTQFIRSHFQGHLIACGGYTIESASDGIKNNEFDLIALGRPFIANHDLIQLVKNNMPLQTYEGNMLNELN